MAGFDLLSGSPPRGGLLQAPLRATADSLGGQAQNSHIRNGQGRQANGTRLIGSPITSNQTNGYPAASLVHGAVMGRNSQYINRYQDRSNSINEILEMNYNDDADLPRGMGQIGVTHSNAAHTEGFRAITSNTNFQPRASSSSSSFGSSSTDPFSVGSTALPTSVVHGMTAHKAEAAGKNEGKGKETTTYSPPSSISPDCSSANNTSFNIEAHGQKFNTEVETCEVSGPGFNHWAIPPLRDQVLPNREPATPGFSGRGIPANNFRGGPHSDLAARPQQLPQLQQTQEPGSSQSYNQVFNTQPGVVKPSIYRSNQAPIGTGRLNRQGLNNWQPVQASSSLDREVTGSVVANPKFEDYAPLGEFRPMNAVNRTFFRPEDDPQQDLKVAQGVSVNYKGDATNQRNLSEDIAEWKNVSFFLTNLPPDVTYSQLLSQIRGMGRVWATVINPPDNSNHHTSAAKLVFFELAAAQRFYAYCRNPAQRLIIGGYAVKIVRNRIKKSEEDVGGYHSRVLIVMGDLGFVNKDRLLRYFRSKLEFDLEEVICLVQDPQTRMGELEIRFACYRNQAESARKALSTEYPPGATLPGGRISPIWELRYGTDPCSV
ncbi:hypothetical protein CORC01_03913 [Colletotrichum orchidophilum]|uniref:RRM domain-containing protein n=1 Tax=Colletotrichum orchidophilum TaxID=1209926 RepID=A0A1G4BHG2_9PEZI|nr:uncharacterized protein CORC01_03913 [Colletotrichum orchidophilum]OHF00839.1 hypothetical protein CORC01_03913 [Colletotrichum orchidophilum]